MSKKGVTLVELLGALVIGAIATGLIISIFISFTSILNTIYQSGSANSQSIMISSTVMRELNDFQPNTVTLNVDEDTMFFTSGLNIMTIKKTIDGDTLMLSYDIGGEETPLTLSGYHYTNIDFSITSSDDGRLKTAVINIEISNDVDTYEFLISFLVINYT